jgi:hypothetical protein
MALSGVRRLAMSKMVAKEKKPVKAVFGLLARILGTGGRKILVFLKQLQWIC